ncbi:MAG TPA: 3-hydroxyacyl-CoA dehydrogenase/enoyl-CoA hydratase family protein [Rhodocyclaceae bacterium]|nr:3-hydroxyacyl-CoA dehydrogenase/enoyl-CoA hydratase family protein [Rhodocyclaceae bacterium]
MKPLTVRQAAVLGAGVMGAQIAAHLANAGVPVLLFDLPGPADKNAIARKALDGLKKLQPAPLASRERLALIAPANYDEDLPALAGCDLIIEAIAERLDWKRDLYARIAPHLGPAAVVASNTSGLSIAALAQALPAAARARFCGIHFFNPPRYMTLVEIVPTPDTDGAILDALETWLVSCLGKGVVRALDTPNFVANRIGVFSMLAVMHHTVACGLGFDEVDALTGPLIGRPKSATYRTADVVGLDVVVHAIRTMADTLPDDPWRQHFRVPDWLTGLVSRGALGQKSGTGIYRKEGKAILVLDPAAADFRPSAGEVAESVAEMLKSPDPAQRFAALRASDHPQARFLWAIFRDVFHYAAVQLEAIADNARDVDFAIRWGFGWSQGPFEIWQSAGWSAIAQAIADDIAAGLALGSTPLPAWVFDGRAGVHGAGGSWSPRRGVEVPRSSLPVYRRQRFPEALLGEGLPGPAESGETLYENAGVRLWRLPEADPGIGILSIKSRMHTLGIEVLEGLHAAIAQAERDLDGAVIWHDPPFAVGANLKQVVEALAGGQFDLLEATVEKFQRTSQALKYSRVPVVAAVQGMALGGGCEFLMHAAKRVLALESYIGLVEAGIGGIPAGGGCKEFALRAAEWARRSPTPNEVFPFLQNVFTPIAMAKVAGSAQEAMDLGFVRETDTVVFHPRELLHVALAEARALAESGYVPPPPARDVPVAGRTGIATLEMVLLNMKAGGMISAHDYRVARCAAVALCGGEVDAGSRVDEEWLLTTERRLFVELLKTPETQARIRHMVDTGKPLRN